MPDYLFLLESRLSPEQHAALARIQELAQKQGVNLYLTGGAIRDLLSGAPIGDLDFTVEGNPGAIVRELERGGARIVADDPKLRETELLFPGDAEASVSAAREEVYPLPGTRPETRWATIMEDLRRRDFSINAIALSLNPASRGLLLDPTNGLADIERREVRALSIHCFTNQPARLLRILRFASRLDFKMESRTGEWFSLALERGLERQIPAADAGRELRELGREERPAATLKGWEARGLLATLHPHLAKRRPDYEGLGRLGRIAEQLREGGLKPRLFAPITWYVLRRLTPRERSLALHKMELRSEEVAAVTKIEAAAREALKALRSRQTDTAKDAYRYLERLPLDVLAFQQAEFPHPRASSRLRNYLQKWRPMRLSLPAAELESLGVARGPQFDRILEQFFELELRGKGRTPIDRARILRQLAGIKPEAKKPAGKPAKAAPGAKAAPSAKAAAAAPEAAGKPRPRAEKGAPSKPAPSKPAPAKPAPASSARQPDHHAHSASR